VCVRANIDAIHQSRMVGHNGAMGLLLVVTGPPGAGKSSIGAVLAAQLDRSALIEGDAFFRFLRTDAMSPWLPEAHEQNTAVTRAAGAAAGHFARGGLNVVYDGVIGPWFLDDFTDEAAARHMYDEFARSDIGARHVLHTSSESAETIAGSILGALDGGNLTYTARP
jgi:adenylylsulfate kinase-like enzyme